MFAAISLKYRMAWKGSPMMRGVRASAVISGLAGLLFLAILSFPQRAAEPSPFPRTGAVAVPMQAVSAGARPAPIGNAPAEALTPQMQVALDYVSRRYRVSAQALGPIFRAVQRTGRELRLDPLLIVAVIGVESRFNPFSESTVGAQGLMQVMPRFHSDKLPQDAGELPFFDPVTNIRVGSRVLEESIRRNGGLVAGLQQFGGAQDDVDQTYASRVLAEKQRLEQACVQFIDRSA